MIQTAVAPLHAHAGIENHTIDNSASYISNWYDRLSKDRRLFIQAAASAQKAADWVLGEYTTSPRLDTGTEPTAE